MSYTTLKVKQQVTELWGAVKGVGDGGMTIPGLRCLCFDCAMCVEVNAIPHYLTEVTDPSWSLALYTSRSF